MKAKITKNVSNAYNYSRDKELVSSYNVVGKVGGELRDVVTARCYMGRSSSASVVYASLWVHVGDNCTSGKGSAGGGGYHKQSAAIGEAISSAGIELYGDVYAHDGFRSWYNPETKQSERTKEDLAKRAHIGGVGDSAIEAALLAIAKAAGVRGKMLIVRN
jgi:hypothetical protein